jgi:hypothetical protein
MINQMTSARNTNFLIDQNTKGTYSVKGSKKKSDRKTGMCRTTFSKSVIRFSKASVKSAHEGDSCRLYTLIIKSVKNRGD